MTAALAWREVPPGYQCPDIFPARCPLCSHWTDSPAGPAADCDVLATRWLSETGELSSGVRHMFACGKHATAEFAQAAGLALEEDFR
jgi:hypothetical protein